MKIFLALLPFCAMAAPQGLQVMAGSAHYENEQVHASEPSILHWETFSIDAHEAVHYPSAHPTLNRVVGSDASQILGSLTSNGALYLLNPNGVFIGPDARIDTARFIASTFDVLDDDFLAGREPVFDGDSGAAILHHGQIHAGEVRLVARNIYMQEAASRIAAPSGEIHLLGDEVVIGRGAELCADGGGKVLVLGEDVVFHGRISIRGTEGDGGFAEVSGVRLDYRGVTDARAPKGRFGTLLLDPTNITIGSTDSGGMFDSCPDAMYTPIGDNNQIDASTLSALLEMCNVTISTVSGAMQAGTIAVSEPVAWNAATTLTLTAHAGITLGAAITCTGAGAIDLINVGGVAGDYHGIVVNNVAVATTGGNLSLEGIGGSTSGNNGILVTGASGSVATVGGTISLHGTASAGSGIYLISSGIVESDTGNILIDGFSGGGNGFRCDTLDGVRSNSGNITITAVSSVTNGISYSGAITRYVRTGGTIRFLDCAGASRAVYAAFVTSGSVEFENCVAGNVNGAPAIEFFDACSVGGSLTFSNCQGGSGSDNHAILVAATLSVTGNIIATDQIRGGTGSGSCGFRSTAGVTSSGGNIAITASTQGTGAAHGISHTAGTMSTSGTGNIALIGTASTMSTAGRGVNLSGLVTTSGSGAIRVAGHVPMGAAGAGIGVYLLTSTNRITNPGGGAIFVSGVSEASGTGSQGVRWDTSWTTGTTGAVTFGVPITDGTVTIEGCRGGSGDQSHGLLANNVFSTGGSIFATNQIVGGTGTQSHGFVGASNFQSTGGGSIAITASTLAGGATASHGISYLTNTMSTSGSITLIGTASAANSGTSCGINLTGLVTTSGNISLTGTVPMGATGNNASGIQISGGANRITSPGGGTIALIGTSHATGTGAHGISLESALATGSAGTLQLTGLGGIAGSSFDINLAGNITNNGAVTFHSPVQLASTGRMVTSMGTIIFADTVNGAFALDVSGMDIDLQAAIGNATPIGALICTGATTIANNISAASAQFNSAVTLTGPSSITTTGATTFASTVSGTHNLTLDASAITFSGVVDTTPLGALICTGATSIGNNISAASAQFNSAATLTGLSLITTTGATTFASAVNGTHNLTLDASAITFSGVVGGVTPLGALACTGATSIGNNISAASAQFNSAATLTGPSIITTSGSATFAGTVNGSHNLTLNASAITFSGVVDTTPLGALICTGATSIGNNISAASAQFNSAATLTGLSLITTTGATTFASAVNGTHNLTLDASAITFSGVVGGVTPLGALACTGATSIGNNISAASAQFNSAVTLTGPSIITTSGSATFAGTVNGSHNLTLNASAITFGGVVDTTPLGALACTGATTIANNISAASAQFNSAATLTGPSIITTTGATTFASTVSGTHNLTLDASAITFSGVVGGVTPLGALICTGATTIANNISAASVLFNGAVTLAGSPTIHTSGAQNFSDAVNGVAAGMQGLTLLSDAGIITIGASIGQTTGLGPFYAEGEKVLLGGSIQSTSGVIAAPVEVTDVIALTGTE